MSATKKRETRIGKRETGSQSPIPDSRFPLAALSAYKVTLSPLLYFLGARCRHAPTCSEYAAEAFRRHGAGKGAILALSRVCRCHPFGSHGFDPVPDDLPDAGWRVWRYGDWAWARPSAREASHCSLDSQAEGESAEGLLAGLARAVEGGGDALQREGVVGRGAAP